MKSLRFRQLFIVTLVLSAFGSPAFAAPSGFRAGVLGGVAVTGSTVSSGGSPNLDSSSTQVGYKAGFEGDYDVLPSLVGVEADVLYTQYSWLLSVLGGAQDVSFTTNWWEIPVFVNYTGLQWFKFGMGPFFDFAGSQVSQYGWGSFSAGIGAQTAFAYPLNIAGSSDRWVLNVDLRYMMGLTNLYNDGSPNDVKVHSFDVLAGLQYAF